MILDNKLFLCPAGRDKPLRRVLDAGCGTGIWSMDLGTLTWNPALAVNKVGFEREMLILITVVSGGTSRNCCKTADGVQRHTKRQLLTPAAGCGCRPESNPTRLVSRLVLPSVSHPLFHHLELLTSYNAVPSSVQPNVEFFVDDLEDPWTFNNKFDLIYLRAMTGSFKDWPKLFRQAYE